MPYSNRSQLNLKLTAAERALLEEEAALAGVSLTAYARHLLVHRPVQPLSIQAAQLQRRYQIRDEVQQEQLAGLQHERLLRRQLEQQVWALQQQNQQLQDPAYLRALIDAAIEQALARGR